MVVLSVNVKYSMELIFLISSSRVYFLGGGLDVVVAVVAEVVEAVVTVGEAEASEADGEVGVEVEVFPPMHPAAITSRIPINRAINFFIFSTT